MSLNRKWLFWRETLLLLSRLHLRPSSSSSPPLRQSHSANWASQTVTIPPHISPPKPTAGLQRGSELIHLKRAGQSRGRPRYTRSLSAGGCGDGLLELLAADLAGAGLQELVVAGVADQHWVVQLLVWDGQLQMTTVFTEHIATVPVEQRTQSLDHLINRLDDLQSKQLHQ